MDIADIEYAIETLENADSTVENVDELANLYIVYDHMKAGLKSTSDDIKDELRDILPAYRIYCGSKRKYQLGQINEGEVIHSLNLLCRELSEFVNSLYSGTDMNKERIYIRKEITKIYEKLTK